VLTNYTFNKKDVNSSKVINKTKVNPRHNDVLAYFSSCIIKSKKNSNKIYFCDTVVAA
jgi:hypothetical protein